MCNTGMSPEIPKKGTKYFWKTSEDGKSVSFYTRFGEKYCPNATSWCLKHCYLKRKPFSKKNMKDLQNTDMYDSDRFYQCFSKYEAILRQAKYVTFFAGGSINRFEDWPWFLGRVCGKYNNAIFRIFTRGEISDPDDSLRENLLGIKFKEKTYGGKGGEFTQHLIYYENVQLLFSVDCDTDKNLVDFAISENYSYVDVRNKLCFDKPLIDAVAIVKHIDNEEIINYCRSKIDTVIDCDSCNSDYRCFKEKEKFLLLWKYQ